MKKYLLIILLLSLIMLNAEWSSDAQQNNQISSLTGDQTIPKTAQNADGSCYIGWWSNATGNYNMRLQYMDAEGDTVWEQNGLLISDHAQMSWLTDWDMTSDLEGNAVMAFNDIRDGEDQLDIIGYKISPEGEFIWGENGINLSNGGFNAAPVVTVNSDNNAVFAWADETSTKVMSVSPTGELNWEQPITIEEGDTSNWPQLIPAYNDDEDGAFLLKYYVNSGPYWAPDRFVYLMKYSAAGNELWDTPAVVSDAAGISAWTQFISFVPDGSGGAVLAWHDDRNGENISRAYVQHITASGEEIFTDGVQVGDHGSNNQYYPKAVYMPATEMIHVYWRETDANQNQAGVLGQKIDSSGELLFGNAGITVSPIQSTGGSIISLRPFGDNVAVIYSVYAWGNFTDDQILAECLDAEGNDVWSEPAVISDMQTTKLHIDTADYQCTAAGFCPDDGFILSWSCGDDGIYAQRFNSDGSIGIPSAELPAPVNLQVEVNYSDATLSWEMPQMRPINGFNLYWDGELYSYIDDPEIREYMLNYYTTASVEVYLTAVYAEGESAPSNTVIVEFEEFPYPPEELTVDAATGLMEWLPPLLPDNRDLLGYNVYLDDEFVVFTEEEEYLLTNLITGQTYNAGVAAVYTGSSSQAAETQFTYTPVGSDGDILSQLSLKIWSYPNPFNPQTTFKFAITEPGYTNLSIYNIKGQLVEVLIDEQLNPGTHSIIWDAEDMPSGMYYGRIQSGLFSDIYRVVLIK